MASRSAGQGYNRQNDQCSTVSNCLYALSLHEQRTSNTTIQLVSGQRGRQVNGLTVNLKCSRYYCGLGATATTNDSKHFFCWSTFTSGNIKAVNPALKQVKALHIVQGVRALLRRAVAELHGDSFDPGAYVLRHKQSAHLVTENNHSVAA